MLLSGYHIGSNSWNYQYTPENDLGPSLSRIRKNRGRSLTQRLPQNIISYYKLSVTWHVLEDKCVYTGPSDIQSWWQFYALWFIYCFSELKGLLLHHSYFPPIFLLRFPLSTETSDESESSSDEEGGGIGTVTSTAGGGQAASTTSGVRTEPPPVRNNMPTCALNSWLG